MFAQPLHPGIIDIYSAPTNLTHDLFTFSKNAGIDGSCRFCVLPDLLKVFNRFGVMDPVALHHGTHEGCEISGINRDVLGARLIPNAVRAVSEEQIHAIRAEALTKLTPLKLKTMSPSQITSVTASQLKDLNADQIETLTKSQVSA